MYSDPFVMMIILNIITIISKELSYKRFLRMMECNKFITPKMVESKKLVTLTMRFLMDTVIKSSCLGWIALMSLYAV